MSFHNTAQIEIGFGQLDQSESEGTGMISIALDKTGNNVGALEVTVMAITYDPDDEGIPEELVTRGLPDPAECKYQLTCTQLCMYV